MNIRKVSLDEWQRFVEECPSATFFHTPSWYKIWKFYRGLDIEAFSFTSEHFTGLMPLAYNSRYKGLVKEYESSPGGVYGGLISNNEPSDSQLGTISDFLNNLGSFSIHQSPFHHSVIELPDIHSRPYFTQLIDLKEYCFEQDWYADNKRCLKIAFTKNISVSVAETNEEWGGYFKAYRESLKRWGQKTLVEYGYSLFDYCRQLPKSQCRLWVIKYREEVISGALCFYHNDHVVYWHGASKKEFFHLKPVHLLLYTAIKHAKEESYKWFDFNPSGGLKGVEKFKAGFGAKKVNYTIYSKATLVHKAVNKIESIFN